MERGKKLGQQAKQQIAHNVESYQIIFREMSDVGWDDARAYALEYIPYIERYDREIMEEIKGISLGSGQDLIDLLVLNARSEIITNLGRKAAMTDGCTSVAATSEMTRTQETLLGQNWDWHPRITPGMIVLEIIQPPRPTILMVTEAGIVGKIGMNSEGLGVCLNFLGTSEQAMGVPIHIVLRGILNSRTLPQAVGPITRMDRGTSANYLIAHREGEALDVESTPSNYDALYPEDGWLVHTNHFVGPRMVNIHDTARLNFPDTHLRYGRATKLLAKRSDSIDKETFKQIFRDHKGFPDSICRHGEASPPELGRPVTGSTVFSIIMNLSTGTFELAKGQPCEVGYDSYGFCERAAMAE